MLRTIAVCAALLASLYAQTPDPAYAPLQKAYDALRANNYDAAIVGFQQAIAAAPNRAAIHKDLAYTLLKVGENEAARDQFAEAMSLDANDQHVALEYAFLCYETKQEAVARRVFDRIRKTGNATAEQAFQNIDRPLAEGIARWSKALEMSPDNFSAHQELAKLAEQRDELALAAQHYEAAFKIKPGERSLLLDMGRVWKALGRNEDAMSALLAASRGAQPRVAERARELLPSRYPYVYEFENAIKLDPKNVDLRRELAYLLLEMDRKPEAESQFRAIHELAPDDLLSTAQLGFLMLKRNDMAGARPLLEQVLKGNNEELADRVRSALNKQQSLQRRGDDEKKNASLQAKALGEKSFQAGYLNDALKYLTVAQEADPLDFDVMLKLGWTHNMLHDDIEAIHWFLLASRSPDPKTSLEATTAYKNLRPQYQRLRFTAWMFPFYSTRWHDAFGYAQAKEEMKLWRLPLHVYLSARFVGDVREKIGATSSIPYPQYLSESSVIFGVGVATKIWRGITGWAEAGESVKYLHRTDLGAAIPDYRGGISFGKGKGHLMGGHRGWFAETNDDGVYVSRFENDMLLYSQNRGGYTFSASESGFQPQLYWNANVTTDRLGQYWANFAETGPGLKFKAPGAPRGMVFQINFLRGAFLVNEGNPRRPNYFDLRAGLWYAFTR